MIVLSKTPIPSSISTGTSPRGFAVRKSPPLAPDPIASGIASSKGIPFSRKAIFTFCA